MFSHLSLAILSFSPQSLAFDATSTGGRGLRKYNSFTSPFLVFISGN